MLKTLLTTAHIMPAYRMASRTTQNDSCVICYRVYTVPSRQGLTSRGSIEDINSNFNYSESPSKRSLNSTSSLGSADIREFVSADELDHFCPILKLGSIRTEINELDVSVCYRTDIRSSGYLLKSPRSRDVYNRILDEDCLTAAKQLLAGNDVGLRGDTRHGRDQHYYYKSGSCNSLNGHQDNNNRGSNAGGEQKTLAFLDQPLKPAFANASENCLLLEQLGCYNNNSGGNQNHSKTTPSKLITSQPDGLIESAFESLLQKNEDYERKGSNENNSTKTTDGLINIASEAINSRLGQQKQQVSNKLTSSNGCRSTNAQSEPIQVPMGNARIKSNQQDQNNARLSLTPGSTPKSLTDSYVFVDLNPPFASDEQNDINSFFHGPSPSFTNGLSSLKDVEELTSQLATIEANASQIDDFVDNICASEDEEDDEATSNK